MLFNVIIEVIERLDLMQIAHRDGDLIRHLNEGDQIHQVDTIELQCLLQRSLRVYR